ncbi:hypothetical protein [Streptomyces sp. NPDC001500]
MSKQEKAALGLVVALIGSAYLGKVAKEQGAALGMSAMVVSVLGYAAAYAIA